jgi:NADH:ubiquinone oxidoreductase subunit K
MEYIILSMTLLAIGIYGLATKYDLIKLLISIEMITIAASMNFVIFASSLNDALGQAFMILAFSVDTCITAVALALVIIVYRKLGTLDIRELSKLKE